MPSSIHSRSAQRGKQFTPSEKGEETPLYNLIRFFLTSYEHLYEKRLQNLVFYTDYRYYQKHGEQLTDAEYERHMGGFISHDVYENLESMPVDSKPVSIGFCTSVTEYSGSGVPHIDTLDLTVVFSVLKETRDIGTEDLEAFARNTPMHSQTNNGNIAEFTHETVDMG